MKKIFILHGWAFDTLKWEPFLKELRSNKVNPIMLKIPGLTDKIDRVWNVDDYVEWLKNKLKNEKDIILLGHSNGGKIALTFGLKYPKKVEKIILIDSSGIYHNELLLRIKRFIFKLLAKIGKKITKSDKLRNLLYKFARENDYNESNEIMKSTMQNLINVDLTPKLSQIIIPTVIIWGKDDSQTPVQDAYVFKNQIPNSELFLIDGARHSPQFTHVNEVSKIIYEHI